MNPLDLFNQVKEMIEKKDFDATKKFVDDNKDNLGDYLEQAKGLVSGNGQRCLRQNQRLVLIELLLNTLVEEFLFELIAKKILEKTQGSF